MIHSDSYNVHITIPIDWGNDVAGPAPTSPLRHSVPHWYGLMPRRDMAGAGPVFNHHGSLVIISA